MRYVLAGGLFERYETKHIVTFRDDEDMSQNSEKRALCGRRVFRNGEEPVLEPELSEAHCNICAALYEREKMKQA